MDKNALLFLLKLAWDCRFKLPLIITIGFMVLDLRMQLDVTIETRHVRRPVRHAHQMGQNNQRHDDADNHSEGTSNSWSTIDEEYDDDDLDNYDDNIENT